MHFGLYAFDLFETIYEEAWEKGLINHREFGDGDEAYTNFRRAIPRLIIERNIHGIDIDPRAVQIAGLSLWLRAQKAWHAQGVKAAERPIITRSNIVCAEPMPGDQRQFDEFLKQLRDQRLQSLIARVINVQPGQTVHATPSMADALCNLVRKVWDEMKLAGEAGSLLKIEEALTGAIAKGRKEWDTRLPLFRVTEFAMTRSDADSDEGATTRTRYFKTVPDDESDFWDRAEALVLAALEEYATQAQNGQSYVRRLFAHDAVQGFAFIDLCRKRYDVVVMNPPFVETQGVFQQYLRRFYPENWTNTYSAFMERSLILSKSWIGLVCPDGFLSAYRMRNLREQLIVGSNLDLLTVLGTDVFDGMGLSTAALTISSSIQKLTPALLDISATQMSNLTAISRAHISEKTSYILTPELISSGMTEWAADPLEPGIAIVTSGNRTFDDFRYIRAWWEVIPSDIGEVWQRWQKGGNYQPFFSSTPYVVKWELRTDGAEIREFGRSKVGSDAQVAQSSSYWWRFGLVGPANTTGAGFNLRVLPSRQIFSKNSTVIIPQPQYNGYILLALINSRVLRWFLLQLGAGLSGNSGKIKSLPIIWPNRILGQELEVAVKDAVSIMQQLESVKDTSPIFIDYVREFQALLPRYKSRANEIEQIVRTIYGITVTAEEILSLDELAESAVNEATGGYDAESIYQNRLLYLLMLAFGRWDIRHTIGKRQPPSLPDPFAPLPICPPGMLQSASGLPATPTDVPEDYPLRISWSGILVDDPGHPEDVQTRVREALQVIWGARAEAIEQEACTILGVRTLRDYLAIPNNFFDDHLSRYSTSRRVAPICWPLSTASGSYTLWLYYHRLTDQTLYRCVNDFVDPKRKEVAEQLGALQRKTGRSRDDERELERLATLDQELADFRDELLRVAAFWKPNLNDGVQITAAPLYRLFNHRQWRKRLQETWEKLEAGDYDWAHLAYSIWPDRVRAKCRTDKSLAIAHDLEALYVEPPASKSKAKRGKSKKVQDDDAQVEMELDVED
jgi:hypothetical protein